MADHKPLDANKLKLKKFLKSFSDRPHKIWAHYDNEMDELSIRVVKPDVPAALFYVSDKRAYLVNDKSNEVIGVMVADFVSEMLGERADLQKAWEKYKLADLLSEYQELSYQPVKRKQNTQSVTDRILAYTALESRAEFQAVGI